MLRRAAVMKIRAAADSDFDAILALNEEWVGVLSLLDEARLARLHRQSACHQVVQFRDDVVGFLLALSPGADYDSPNYRWFESRYTDFLYIDRVVVSSRAQGRGVGRALYADLFAFAARAGVSSIACEFDVMPPNIASEAFHRRLGFLEVGRHSLGAGAKIVSLQVARPARD